MEPHKFLPEYPKFSFQAGFTSGPLWFNFLKCDHMKLNIPAVLSAYVSKLFLISQVWFFSCTVYSLKTY